MRGIPVVCGVGMSSSVRSAPDVAPTPVPEVTTKGRFEPASSVPMVSMARRSIAQTSSNFEKSWTKAVWMTPSDLDAPLRRLSRS